MTQRLRRFGPRRLIWFEGCIASIRRFDVKVESLVRKEKTEKSPKCVAYVMIKENEVICYDKEIRKR